MNQPIIKEEQAGNYAWCACGKSDDQPYCDGSHKGTNIKPIMTHIKTKTEVAWCGCKCSEHPPFCDGSHATLEE